MKAALLLLLTLGLSSTVHAQPGQWQFTINNNWGYTVVDVPAAVEIPEISGGEGLSLEPSSFYKRFLSLPLVQSGISFFRVEAFYINSFTGVHQELLGPCFGLGLYLQHSYPCMHCFTSSLTSFNTDSANSSFSSRTFPLLSCNAFSAVRL